MKYWECAAKLTAAVEGRSISHYPEYETIIRERSAEIGLKKWEVECELGAEGDKVLGVLLTLLKESPTEFKKLYFERLRAMNARN